jgi:hypothetical protein
MAEKKKTAAAKSTAKASDKRETDRRVSRAVKRGGHAAS